MPLGLEAERGGVDPVLIKKKTPEGLRVRTCAGGMCLMLHIPLAMSIWVLMIALIGEKFPWTAKFTFCGFVLVSLWFSSRVLALGIEFRSDSMVVHSLIKRTLIYREELRVAACWYDRGRASDADAVGVAFAFEPTRPSVDGAPRGTKRTAGLALVKFIFPGDIRSIAVLIQKWWQTGPVTILPNGETVTRVVRPSGYDKTRDEVLDESPEWWVLYDAVEPKPSLMQWSAGAAISS